MLTRMWIITTFCCFVTLMSACGGNTILTLADTGPSKIDLNVSLSIGLEDKNILDITVFHNKTWVAMNHGETMVCNGVNIALDPDHIGFLSTDFPMDTPTTPVTCVYLSRNNQASFTLTPLPPPQIISPISGATLDPSQPLTVTYTPGHGSLVRGSPSVSDGVKTSGNNSVDKADNGSITLDMSGLHAGAGTITLTRFMDMYPSDTGFHAIELAASTTTTIDVTWS